MSAYDRSRTLARLGCSRAILARTLPFAIYISFLALDALLGAQGFGDLRWLYALRITAVASVLAFFWNDYTELHRASDGVWWHALTAIVAGILVLLVWINLDSGWVTLGSSSGGFAAVDTTGGLDWGLIAVRIAGAALVVPVMEELFWRSFVQRWLDSSRFLDVDPCRVSLRALLITSVAFGFEHGQWLAGIVAGLAYGWLYRRTGRLWPAVLAHAVTNFLLGCWVVRTGQWHFW